MTNSKGGRPKGTTNEKIDDLKKCKAQTLNYAAVQFDRLKTEAMEVGAAQVPRNEYTEIMSNHKRSLTYLNHYLRKSFTPESGKEKTAHFSSWSCASHG